jgi:hypothetical protein
VHPTAHAVFVAAVEKRLALLLADVQSGSADRPAMRTFDAFILEFAVSNDGNNSSRGKRPQQEQSTLRSRLAQPCLFH